MRYFKEEEFRGEFDKMDPHLLEVLDNFRHYWQRPVLISPADGAIGRTTSRSFHNWKRHGSIKAIDIMPIGLDNAFEAQRAYRHAVQVGALGIGIYPDWKPRPGMHLDVGKRAGRFHGNPAKWSAFRINGVQRYFGVEKAFREDSWK